MTQDPRFSRAKTKRPPSRCGDACAMRANAVPAREPNSQIQAMLTARRSGWRGGCFHTATTRDAAVPHQQSSGGIQRP
jgi:hypothetical protein